MSTTQPIKDKRKLIEFRNYYKNVRYKPRNYALIVLGLNSALRIGDILLLRWNNVYKEEKGAYRRHITITEKKNRQGKLPCHQRPLHRSVRILPDNPSCL